MTYTPYQETKNPFDYNDAKAQGDFDVIPRGTVARVILGIKPGGHYDQARGWNDGYATCNSGTGSVYLSCEYTVQEGPYAGRKIWGLIGLHSPKGDTWFQLGRSFIKAILNSARGFTEKDTSAGALAARQIHSFSELDGIEFVARIEASTNKETGIEHNVIKAVLTKDHPDYAGHDSGYYAGASSAASRPAHAPLPSSATPPWSR
jgi:hypothetical protein